MPDTHVVTIGGEQFLVYDSENTGQQLDALFTATGESTRPMPMMIGPVTTGGKNFITVLTPHAFTRPATIK